jgi:hypothetical protein
MDLGIVEFTYNYDDEEEDKCTIKIQASNHGSIDALNISRNSVLKVKWGYIGGPLSPLASIAVRDIKSKYGPNIIYTEYQCTDLTAFLRLVRAQDIRKMSLVQFISFYAANTVNIVIQSGNDVIYKKFINLRPEVEERIILTPNGLLSINPEVDLIFPFNPIERPVNGKRELTVSGEDLGEWYESAKWADIKKFFEKEIDMVSINRSPYTIIEEYLQTCPYGPWFITGRGNTLLIHNRNMGNKVYREYSYAKEPGYLMDFTPETKYDSFEKQVISNTSMDPKTGITSNFEAYLERLANAKSFKDIIEDKTVIKEERQKLIQEFILNYIAFKKSGVKRVVYDVKTGSYGYETNYTDNNINPNISRADYAAKANEQYIILREGQPNFTPFQIDVGSVVLYCYPLDTPEDSAHRDDNTFRKLQMETEEADIIVEGDPWLMSEHVLAISNVQLAHIGKYYIKKCEHNITQMGYRTSLETTRVKDEAIVKSLRTDYNSKIAQEEIKNIYHKQQRVFANWDIIITFNILVPSYGLAKVGTREYKQNSVTFDEMLLTNNPDILATQLNEYVEAKNKGNLTIKITSTDPESR